MALERNPILDDMPAELDREAFIREAVMSAQRTYALEREMASLASHTIPTRSVIGHRAVARTAQSATRPVAQLPAAQKAITRTQAMGLDRCQLAQSVKPLDNRSGQATKCSAKCSGCGKVIRYSYPKVDTNSSRSEAAANLAPLPSAKPVKMIQTTPEAAPKTSIASQISRDPTGRGNSEGICASGGPKAGSSKSTIGGHLPGHANVLVKLSAGLRKTEVVDTATQGHKPLPSAGIRQRREVAAGKPRAHNTLSPAQFECEITKMIPVNSADQDVQLNDADFDRIAEILLKADREEWSFRPRTYAVLKMSNAVDLMDDFVKAGCLDISLPYRRGHLPKGLSSEQLDHFLKNQNCVMTNTASIEGGLKAKHANFPDDADNHLEVLNKLGEGGTGEVDRIRGKLSRKIYARKRLKREETFEQNLEALQLFKREVSHLKKLQHRHLVRYVGSYTDPQYVGIIMDPVADMDLRTFLSQSEFTQAEYDGIREAFGCLCSAIIYLHRQQVRHKDIKPQNILVRQRKIFITDFGLAISWKTLGKGTTTGEHGPISRDYAAPEVMDSDSRNISADVWSLGCVYLEMITVLKGETIVAKSAYFLSSGTCSTFYCRNQDAMKGWMKRLESKKDNAPLDWIRNLTMSKPSSRLTPQQLMDRITSGEDGVDYYGLCCDGKKDDEVAIELRDSDVEVSSGSDGKTTDGPSIKKKHDPATVEKHLCKAALAQDVKMLKRWLRKVDQRGSRGFRTAAIHHAAALGNEEMTKILIDFGCSLGYQFKGVAPLSAAIQASCVETTELLARTKIAINAPNLDGRTALHLAVLKSFHTAVRILLRAGTMVDSRDRFEFTPLHRAIQMNSEVGVRLLLDHGADASLVISRGFRPLHMAASRASDKIMQMLLDRGAEVDAYDAAEGFPPAIHMAVQHNRPTMTQMLLQHGADVNFQATNRGVLWPTVLHVAVRKRLFDLVEILLQRKPNLGLRDEQDSTPLDLACLIFDTRLVQRLLEAGADAKTTKRGLIFDLIHRKEFSTVQLLLDHGVSSEDRIWILHNAAYDGNIETMELLLRNHVPIDAKTLKHFTPLMLAADGGHEAAVRLLAEKGASIDAHNHRGWTALHLAAESNKIEIASLLLEHGADSRLQIREGFNAMGVAAQAGHQAMQDLLEPFHLKRIQSSRRTSNHTTPSKGLQ
ncbi:MAG: hypothetical protein Q9168_002263 [Polycauliona sp. 1 TL-2023]